MPPSKHMRSTPCFPMGCSSISDGRTKHSPPLCVPRTLPVETALFRRGDILCDWVFICLAAMGYLGTAVLSYSSLLCFRNQPRLLCFRDAISLPPSALGTRRCDSRAGPRGPCASGATGGRPGLSARGSGDGRSLGPRSKAPPPSTPACPSCRPDAPSWLCFPSSATGIPNPSPGPSGRHSAFPSIPPTPCRRASACFGCAAESCRAGRSSLTRMGGNRFNWGPLD